MAAAAPTPNWTGRDQRPAQNYKIRRKEVKVTVKSREDKESVGKADTRNILAAIKTREPKEAVKEILAARRLPSGDILLSTLTEGARIALEKSTEWLGAIAPTAEVLRTTFPVFVHGVRVEGVNTNEQDRAITTICEENSLLHPELEITRIL